MQISLMVFKFNIRHRRHYALCVLIVHCSQNLTLTPFASYPFGFVITNEETENENEKSNRNEKFFLFTSLASAA